MFVFKSTCQKLKFYFLLLEYCKIRECYAVANAFTIKSMYSLLLYMKGYSRETNRPTKNILVFCRVNVSPLFLFPLKPGISWKWTENSLVWLEYLSVLCLKVSIYQFCRKQLTKLAKLPVSPPRKRTKTSSSTPNLKSPSIRTPSLFKKSL
jgi:hypothetical protein